MAITITNLLYTWERSSNPNSIRSNQDSLKCGTVMKLFLTPTINGTRLCVLTSCFKGKECGRWKLERTHHSGAPYFYSKYLMGNASFLPSFFTKPRSTPKISITTSNLTGQSITHHLSTWIDTGGLWEWPNYPTCMVPTLLTIRYYYLV